MRKVLIDADAPLPWETPEAPLTEEQKISIINNYIQAFLKLEHAQSLPTKYNLNSGNIFYDAYETYVRSKKGKVTLGCDLMNGNGVFRYELKIGDKKFGNKNLTDTELQVLVDHFGYNSNFKLEFLNIGQLQLLISLLQAAEKIYLDKYEKYTASCSEAVRKKLGS